MIRRKSERGVYERAILEEDVLGQIRSFLEAHGAVVLRIVERVPKCYRCGCWLGASEGGIPDLIGWFPPRSVANPSHLPAHFMIEVKRTKKSNRREKQKALIERGINDGCIMFFASSLVEARTLLTVCGLKLASV